ncbi:hypothetical protein [Curvivirga aplysinae]|uniref:hypothetical protein n=1 Tax=Curvivirga aplysinae TaxID=2529852 RepID=UPI0012BC3600|nr:hypothetical protein [Curvivirga aplysinae]MTI11286.1 hypothetical protein [Curvivirga aplysinae]
MIERFEKLLRVPIVAIIIISCCILIASPVFFSNLDRISTYITFSMYILAASIPWMRWPYIGLGILIILILHVIIQYPFDDFKMLPKSKSGLVFYGILFYLHIGNWFAMIVASVMEFLHKKLKENPASDN